MLQQQTIKNYITNLKAFIKEDAMLCDSLAKNFDSNANKRIKLYNIAIEKLSQLPGDVVLEAELTKNGRYNIGTMFECYIKALADGCKQGIYKKAVHGCDIHIGKKGYEVKVSLSSYCNATPCKPDNNGKYRATILANAEGIWLINADDVASNLDAKGVLRYNIKPGKLYKKFNDVWMRG